MTKQQKITLSASRDIPFNKLMLSQSNVRHVKAGVSIEELAEDIARRTLLSSITVRPVLDENDAETGMYTIPAGGRRFRALELLVKQKRMNKTALVPCIVRTNGLAEEDSLAENVQRAPLHPLDQFRAFQAMREKGRTEVEIAAAFFVLGSVVKQRLKLTAVAPSLLDDYAEEEMMLDKHLFLQEQRTAGLTGRAVASLRRIGCLQRADRAVVVSNELTGMLHHRKATKNPSMMTVDLPVARREMVPVLGLHGSRSGLGAGSGCEYSPELRPRRVAWGLPHRILGP